MSLTQQVQEGLKSYIQPGDRAIDATLGNGHDTKFLVDHGLEVIGFDLQAQAIEKARERVGEVPQLIQACHSTMMDYVPKEWVGNVSLIMFNLGYLPGGDKTVITQTDTTLKALDAALKLLKPDGLLSIVAYPGHSGGDQEAATVEAWANKLLIVETVRTPNNGPCWILVKSARTSRT